LVTAEIEKDGKGDGIVPFRANVAGMEALSAVEGDVDVLRVEGRHGMAVSAEE
jgi:hypothetical protein